MSATWAGLIDLCWHLNLNTLQRVSVMAISASRHGSLPLSSPSLYSNVTQSAGQSGDWLPLTPSTNSKLSFNFGQQTLQLEELHEDIIKPVELPDLDQLILLGDNLKAAFKKTLAFDRDQPDEGLNIGMSYLRS